MQEMYIKQVDDIVRIGTISDINESDRTVRVHFPDIDIVSGWLKVIKSAPFIPGRHTQQKTEEQSGGSGDEAFESHSHSVIIKPWLPDIGDTVLCLFDGTFNGDGYVIGGL